MQNSLYRKGNWIYMTKSIKNLCPIKILQNYLDFALINNKFDEYIFRAITKTKAREKQLNVNKPLTYTRTRDLLLEVLADIGQEKKISV